MRFDESDANFEASKKMALAMLDIVKGAENVGRGVDAVGFLLAFYLHRLREAGLITSEDAAVLVGVVKREVLADLASLVTPNTTGMH